MAKSNSIEPNSILLLGVGNVAVAVAKRFVGAKKVFGTTRDRSKFKQLESIGIEPIFVQSPPRAADLEKLSSCARLQFVVVSFPPDGETDALVAAACREAKAVVYVSATSVYGGRTGVIDAATPTDGADENAKPRLKAEEIWSAVGAMIIRAPGIYGPNSGLHIRLKQGTYSLPEDGKKFVSRIHVDDLAAIIHAALEKGIQKNIYLVGDLEPTTHLEAVQWLCKQMNQPIPTSVPLHAVSHTLRGDRQISSAEALAELGVTLQYPTYREGFLQCLRTEPLKN